MNSLGEPFTLDPREVRRVATKMGIPADAELPVVQVEDYEGDPAIYAPGEFVKDKWVILLPEKELARSERELYTLGRRALDELRHELRHYYKRAIKGEEWKPELPVREQVVWELDAELMGGLTGSLPRRIAALAMALSKEYNIPSDEAWGIIREEALKLGTPNRVLAKAKKLLDKYYKDHPEEKIV